MPPIPIHKNDPIALVASKPDGVTAQTANPPPTRTTHASPSATTTASSNPPAPQPGARPLAPTASYQASSSGPPAPQPGSGPGHTATYTTTETRLSGPPAQFTVPPPSDSQLAGRSTTSTGNELSKPGPTTLNFGLATSQYQSEHSHGAVPTRVSGEERRSLNYSPGYMQSPDNSPYIAGATGQQSSAANDGVGGAAWRLLSKPGEALKSAEQAAWRVARSK